MKCDLSKITCIEDLRLVAKRKMPRMFYDYIDSGSWTETTYRENTSDFKDIRFRQKVLVNMEGRSLETKMIGQDVKMPVAIAPTGFTGMAHADGEILAARAAEKFGIPFTLMKMLNTERRTFRNIVGHAKNVGDLSSLSSWTSEQFDPRLSWDDVARIKDLWGGKLIIKGIMEPEDAEKAAKSGADALVVSNHGGRQLDDTVSAIKALPDVVSAVGSDIEVWMDSGIRSGQDILKAWALGAKGTMIGRAFLYGLGAYGEEGVTRALEILYKEMDISMAFTGHRNIQDVDSSILRSTRWAQDEF